MNMFISLTASIINIPLLNWSVYKNPANFTKQKLMKEVEEYKNRK